MKRHLVLASILSTLALAGVAHAAELTIYTQPGFTGRALTLQGDAPQLGGFGDRASSLIVRSGRWEVCTLPNFSGDCLIVSPGEYSRLDDRFVNRIESARQIGAQATLVPREVVVQPVERVYTVERIYASPEPYPRYEDLGRFSALELYSHPGFRGHTMKFDRDGYTLDRANLDAGIGSVVVREGRWEICAGQNREGPCRVFVPGRYASLGGFDGVYVGSLRRIG